MLLQFFFFNLSCLCFTQMFCFWMASLRRSVERSTSPSSGECNGQMVTTNLRGLEGKKSKQADDTCVSGVATILNYRFIVFLLFVKKRIPY